MMAWRIIFDPNSRGQVILVEEIHDYQENHYQIASSKSFETKEEADNHAARLARLYRVKFVRREYNGDPAMLD